MYRNYLIQPLSISSRQCIDCDVMPIDSVYMCHTLVGLYAIFVVVFGSVLSLSTALTHRHDEESYYHEVSWLKLILANEIKPSATYDKGSINRTHMEIIYSLT